MVQSISVDLGGFIEVSGGFADSHVSFKRIWMGVSQALKGVPGSFAWYLENFTGIQTCFMSVSGDFR